MIEHFKELRKRTIICTIFFICIFIFLFIISETVYDIISIPLLKQIPQGGNIIATKITTPFFIPLKLCFFVAIFLCVPFFLFHTWSFILPGLYEKEKKITLPIIIFSVTFFYIGILFSFYIICPIAISFFANSTPKSVLFMADIENYLEFILTTCLLTGVVFQIPVITKIIIKLNIIKKENLKKKRKFIILFAFIIGMLLTPPDVLSQIILAIPMIALFEFGLIIS